MIVSILGAKLGAPSLKLLRGCESDMLSELIWGAKLGAPSLKRLFGG